MLETRKEIVARRQVHDCNIQVSPRGSVFSRWKNATEAEDETTEEAKSKKPR